MTCQTCGRPAENGVPTHWLGCGAIRPRDFEAKRVAMDPVVICEHKGCSESKREGSGKGAPPKYCDKHSDPKNRK